MDTIKLKPDAVVVDNHATIMSYHKKLSHMDGLYDQVMGDREEAMDEKEFVAKVEELVESGYLKMNTLEEDSIVYSSRNGLTWSDFVHIDDPIKKSILLALVENPITFFVLQNTQKGKMRIASLEIKKWAQDTTKKVVAFIIVDNDKTLSDQSVDGIKKTFGEQRVEIFSLSSNSKTTVREIQRYIDAYEHAEHDDPDYPMPLIALLANNKQCEKKLMLQHHIHKKATEKGSALRYGEIWDEGDKTYSQLRDKPFILHGVPVTCRTFTVEKTQALYRLGFVTATDGQLLDEEYPECANAYLYPADISPEDQRNYRALHHPESITHRVPFTSKHTNNSYAIQIIEENKEHFMTPVLLATGEVYYRKVIVNSNAKMEDMKQFAKWCTTKGMYGIVFNGYDGASIKVYREGHTVETHKTKGKRLNEVLFYSYKKLHLHDKPIVIIGRRKVDRGLGFHYCPRNDGEQMIEGALGNLTTTNREGLVWTDVILGKIEDKNTAVQKAGRGAGIIANSPQYSGETHYWTDEATERLIRCHNTIVDNSNTNYGCSVLQAVTNAKRMLPSTEEHKDRDRAHRVFPTQEEAIAFVKREFGIKLNKRHSHQAPDGFLIEGRNPTVQEMVVDRFRGIDEDCRIRMLPTHQEGWCVYWRPSLFAPAQNEEKKEDA